MSTGFLWVAMAALQLLAALPAGAETLQFNIFSDYEYSVSIEFYSQDDDRAWPGGDEVWVLRDTEVHNFRLNCRSGEKICYGAWSRGESTNYWGVGKNGRNGCSSCCWTCNGGETPTIELNP